MCKPSNLSNEMFHNDKLNLLKAMYWKLYPDVDINKCVCLLSYRKCNLIKIGNKAFGIVMSRHVRNFMIMANWHSGDGKIVEHSEIVSGVIVSIILYNLIVENMCKPLILVQLRWYSPMNAHRFSCGKPIEVWSRG